MALVFARAEEGQALVVVGLAMVVLMGALVLTVDWGYGLAMRRAAQNQADAAVLAAAKLLGTSYVGEDPLASGPMFDSSRASREQVWNAACQARNANVSRSNGNPTIELTVSFFQNDGTAAVPPITSSDPALNSTCAWAGNTSTDHTVFVSVRSSAGYTSLFGRVLASRDIDVTASARARLTAGSVVRPLRLPDSTGFFPVGSPGPGLSGDSTLPNAAMWPIVRRYDPSDWDPAGTRTIQLIRPNGLSDGTYFVSPSHFSPHEAYVGTEAHQPVTESDYTGAPNTHHGQVTTTELISAVPGCPGGPMWNTSGRPDLVAAATCDIPNWFHYGYRGSLAVGTNWGDPSWSEFMDYSGNTEPPPALSAARSSCAIRSTYPSLSAPSCFGSAGPTTGDWVETVTGVETGVPVDLGVVANRILSFVTRFGRDVPVAGGGPGVEKAVVVNLFLWDCGETFDRDPAALPGARWNLAPSTGGDCSDLTTSGPFDRVHLLTAVPVMIRQSGVDTPLGVVRVEAEWGHLFGDPGRCAAVPPPSMVCDLNVFINSAFLVPDE
jgi:Flp pilus assembly protein TadG